LGGNLAIAAYEARFPYVLQEYEYDYEVESHDGERGSQVNRRRPDLYIENEH
jgi:hypothetical protein